MAQGPDLDICLVWEICESLEFIENCMNSIELLFF